MKLSGFSNLSLRVCALAILSWAVAAPGWADDKVKLFKNDEVLDGTVQKDNLDGVVLIQRDARSNAEAQRTIPAADVASIEWNATDNSVSAAIMDFKQGASTDGSYLSSAMKLKTILADPASAEGLRPVVKPYLVYLYAEALYRAGKATEAAPLLKKFMVDFKNSRYVVFAASDLVEIAVQSKAFDAATPVLAQIRALGPDQKSLADYHEGQIMLAQGKLKEAEGLFTSALSGSTGPASKSMALIGLARCSLAAKNFAKARESAQQILALTQDPALAAGAHIIQGDALIGETEGLTDKEALEAKLMDAVVEYVRVPVQYAGDPRTEAEAIFKTATTYHRISKEFRRPAERGRAHALYMKLLTSPAYKNLVWAKQADEEDKKR